MRNDTWMGRRAALHERFLAVARLGDASRLAYINGPLTVWTEEEVAALWRRALDAPVSALEPRNSIYVHVPFCKSICHFCNYDRLQPSSPELLQTWLGRVLRSVQVIAPAVRPLTFHALYIGGGTPSVLPARLLRELLDTLDAAFSWHPGASRLLEFDPAVINRERLEVLATHGFQRLSFGIETLDAEVNVRHNRGRQGLETIERVFADLDAVGISEVACDFLLGLEGTTPEGILAEMETVIRRFRPVVVDIFMVTPTQAYVDSHFGGQWEAFRAHLACFEAVVPPALPALAARTGYFVRAGHGHHMSLGLYDPAGGSNRSSKPNKGGRARREILAGCSYTALSSDARCPVNVIGLGRSARSVIFATAAFSARDPDDNPAVEGPANYIGNAIDVADEARTFLVHRLRDNNTVGRTEFRQIFGGDMTEIIPTALRAWEHEGTAHLEDDVLRFVPQNKHARMRSLLWLVPDEALDFELAHYAGLELSPSGVARLVAPLKPGTRLAGGYTFAGADGIFLLLRTPEDQTLRVRVAAGLTDEFPLRFVAGDIANTRDVASLRRAVGQLRGLVTYYHRQQAKPPSSRRAGTALER